MSQKGFVHLIPLFAVAVVLVGALAALSVRKEDLQKQAVGKVLSDRSGGGDDNGGSSSGSGGSDSNHGSSSGSSSGSGGISSQISGENKAPTATTGVSRVEAEAKKVESEIKTEANKSKVSIENANGKFESETENGKTKTKFEANGLKVEIESENGKLVTKVKDEKGQEVEVNDVEKQDLVDAADKELENDGIKLATGSAELGFVQDGRKVRTNFPLSVDPATGQLFVTTPSGVKAVAVLPSVAIENMIKAGVLTRVEVPVLPEPTPDEGSGSAGATQGAQVSVLGASIQLTEQNNQPVYRISGVKDEKLFGLLPVGVKLTTVVSASNGSLVDIQEGIFARILDLLSN